MRARHATIAIAVVRARVALAVEVRAEDSVASVAMIAALNSIRR
jgi:hypothetical protein